MRNKSKEKNYWIIRHSFSKPEENKVVKIVKGLGAADNAVESFNRRLTEKDSEAGWGHIYEETRCKTTTDLETANELYQSQRANVLKKFGKQTSKTS